MLWSLKLAKKNAREARERREGERKVVEELVRRHAKERRSIGKLVVKNRHIRERRDLDKVNEVAARWTRRKERRLIKQAANSFEEAQEQKAVQPKETKRKSVKQKAARQQTAQEHPVQQVATIRHEAAEQKVLGQQYFDGHAIVTKVALPQEDLQQPSFTRPQASVEPQYLEQEVEE